MEQITKISFTSNSVTTISKRDGAVNNENRQEEKKIITEAFRHPDFQAAMDNLAPLVLKRFDMPDTWIETCNLKHVTIVRTDKDGLGARFCLVKTWGDIAGGLAINCLLLHQDNDESGKSKMTSYMEEAVVKLIDEAEQFLNGKVAPAAPDLFNREPDDEEAAKKWGKKLTEKNEEEDEEEEPEPTSGGLVAARYKRKKKKVVHINNKKAS